MPAALNTALVVYRLRYRQVDDRGDPPEDREGYFRDNESSVETLSQYLREFLGKIDDDVVLALATVLILLAARVYNGTSFEFGGMRLNIDRVVVR
jgi:hypothetical protein